MSHVTSPLHILGVFETNEIYFKFIFINLSNRVIIMLIIISWKLVNYANMNRYVNIIITQFKYLFNLLFIRKSDVLSLVL